MEISKQGLEAANKLCLSITGGYMDAEEFCEEMCQVFFNYAENHTALEEDAATGGRKVSNHLYLLRVMIETVKEIIKGEVDIKDTMI